MKRIKKLLISLVITASIMVVTPDFVPFTSISTSTVQAKTTYVYRTRTGTKYHLKKCGNGNL